VSESRRPTQFGRIHAPDEAWLAQQPHEPILEADLPIIDTHHHLWERPDHRYLLHDFLADVRTGHKRLLPRSRQNQHAHRGIVARIQQRVAQLLNRLPIQRI